MVRWLRPWPTRLPKKPLGDRMIGRRVEIVPHRYEPGDFGRWDGVWYARPPVDAVLLANISGHQVTEHEDGTITVSPSILVSGGARGSWHGFLERGVWRTA